MKKHAKKIIISLISVVILIVAWVAWLAIPGDTTELESVTNKFRPDPSWELTDKNIYPAQKICLSANCDRSSYHWTTSSNVTERGVMDLAESSGMSLTAEEGCVSDEVNTCSLWGSEGDYNFVFYVSKNNTASGLTEISFFVDHK